MTKIKVVHGDCPAIFLTEVKDRTAIRKYKAKDKKIAVYGRG
jgi:hypothetical protein